MYLVCVFLAVFLVCYGIVVFLRIKVSNLIELATDPEAVYDLSYISKDDYESLSQLLIQIGEINENGEWDLGEYTVLSTYLNQSHFDPVCYNFNTNQFVVTTSYSSEIEYIDDSQLNMTKGGNYKFYIYFEFDFSNMEWEISEVNVVYTFS